MPQMSDSELLVVINSYESDSTAYNAEFMAINEELLRRYNGEKYGDEEEGRSSVIATDVADLVDADMTSLVRVFLGDADVMVFEPNTDQEIEVQEAKDKTQYVNHIIRKRPGSYKLIHDWIKDAEIQKMGVLHYFMEDEKKTREVEYEGLSSVEIAALMEELESESDAVERVEIVSQEEIGVSSDGAVEASAPVFNIRFKITENKKRISIEGIPTEDFLISKNSSTKWDANMVGHVSYPTRGELVASGMTEEEVAKFPANSTNGAAPVGSSYQNSAQSATGSTMKEIRWRDEGGNITSQYGEWAAQEIRVVTAYAKVDYDGDGIAERRMIVKIGNTIVENEPFDHVPYAILSGLLDPHKALGRSRGSRVVNDQRIKTVLQRGILDNIYQVNHPRNVVGDKVDLDDMLDVRLDGIIRVDEGGIPQNEVMPLVTPYIGDRTLQVVQYLDSVKAARTGSMMAAQGLEADQLHKETATRFAGVERAAEAKIELVARNFAETGFRELYEGVAWLASHYQDSEQEFLVLGRPAVVRPTDWKYDHFPVSRVGLGAGNGQQAAQSLTGIFTLQQQLKAQGSMLIDEQKIYNTVDQLVMELGVGRTQDYVNNPEVPQELMMAQLEKVTAALQQSQLIIEQLQARNQLAEVEQIKQQGQTERESLKVNADMVKADANLELEQTKIVQDSAQFQADKEFEYTKLELEQNVDIPNQGQGS